MRGGGKCSGRPEDLLSRPRTEDAVPQGPRARLGESPRTRGRECRAPPAPAPAPPPATAPPRRPRAEREGAGRALVTATGTQVVRSQLAGAPTARGSLSGRPRILLPSLRALNSQAGVCLHLSGKGCPLPGAGGLLGTAQNEASWETNHMLVFVRNVPV